VTHSRARGERFSSKTVEVVNLKESDGQQDGNKKGTGPISTVNICLAPERTSQRMLKASSHQTEVNGSSEGNN